MSKKCTYCDVVSRPFGGSILEAFGASVKIGRQTLNLFDGKIKQDCRVVKFCPMCGRKL